MKLYDLHFSYMELNQSIRRMGTINNSDWLKNFHYLDPPSLEQPPEQTCRLCDCTLRWSGKLKSCNKIDKNPKEAIMYAQETFLQRFSELSLKSNLIETPT